ncbi:glycine cleavage H-family protein, partial [Chlamydia psittaci 03DC29]
MTCRIQEASVRK